MTEPDLICERRGAAGFVALNRPHALNAITHGMVRALAAALDRWEADPAVTRVVVTAAGEKAFSAGGDIRQLYDLGRAGRHDEALAFWRDEYRLNIRIKRYPKPYVSLIDGIVMGGGVGISLHGAHRVAGDRYRFAMPEVAIGFFPDVGATFALPRLPDCAGTYLALTGARVGPDDAVRLGLATHAVPSGRMAAVGEELAGGGEVEGALAAAARAVTDGPVSRERAVIARCFAGQDVTEVLGRLDAEGPGFPAETAAAIRTKCPSSLAVALEQMRRGETLSFEDAMATEFRIVNRIVREPDFYEGVRAAIIDKDGNPRWRDPGPGAVDPAWVAAHFDGLGPHDLEIA